MWKKNVSTSLLSENPSFESVLPLAHGAASDTSLTFPNPRLGCEESAGILSAHRVPRALVRQ